MAYLSDPVETRGGPSNTPIRRFFVGVYCGANDLYGSVEVISTDAKSAKDMALRIFFRGGGWAVQGVSEITKDYDRFEGVR